MHTAVYNATSIALRQLRRPHDKSPLVGRDDELALVDALLTRGREQGDVLLLHGDPGVGKSALAAVAVARAEGTVLTTTGVPSEAEIPYAALQQLLWPVLDEAEALPALQRAALDAAMGVGDDAPKDPFRTGLAVLGLLGDVAERAPVVVVAEDAHWIDEPTAEVLAFVARRIEADPIAMLITSRESIPRSLRGLPSRHLTPLGDRRGGSASARAGPGAAGRDPQPDPRAGAGEPARAGRAAGGCGAPRRSSCRSTCR